MKKLRSIIFVFLIVGLTAPLISASAVDYGAENNPGEKVYTQTFSDVPMEHWAFNFIADLAERKAINGFPDGKFYPSNIVTRQEFAKIMVVAAGLTATPVQKSSYADLPVDSWASPFVEAASSYMTAYRNSATGSMTFQPTKGALREDIAVAVVKLCGYETRLVDLSLLDTMFKDADAISTAARPYVALAVENKIISGYVDGTFRGQDTITRAEAAAILWRAFQYGNDEKVIGGGTGTTKPGKTPTPTPPPKPSPVPSPSTPPVPKKPYLADGLVSAEITNTKLLMTMDSDSNLIYYDADKKEILKLDTDTQDTETLLDVTKANYIQDITTYTNLEVRQVFWDKVASRLLVDGEFRSIKKDGADDGWGNSDSSKEEYRAIFDLKDQELKFFARIPDNANYRSIQCALDNGTFALYRYSGMGYSHGYYIYDFRKNSEVASISYRTEGDYYNELDAITQVGRDIYARYWGKLLKYDYGTGKWNEACEFPFISSVYSGIHYQNAAFYTWLPTEIIATRVTGQKKTFLNPSIDIEILDLLKLPGKPDNLFVTQDESFVFYDAAAGAIRMIYKNPNV